MMIKVSNEYLDFDEEVDMEKQIKLFEDISTTDGDFSYSFDIPKTLNNTRLLQNPFPDNINKPVYQQIPAKLLSDGGAETYDGYLRVERVTDVYSCSFFAGNNNWFAMITGLLSELDFVSYDTEQTQANIEYTWTQDEGLVFPLVDNGALITRSNPHLKIEDFVGGFYIKTIFNRVFVEAGIKIKGELLNDWMFNNAICLKNSKSQEEIDARSSFVLSNGVSRPSFNTLYKITWDNDSIYPYSDGVEDNFDLVNDRYVADIKMVAKVEVNVTAQLPGGGGLYISILYIYVNGVEVKSKVGQTLSGSEVNSNITVTIPLNANDYVEVFSIYAGGAGSDVTRATIKVTPTFVYKTFGKAAVPNWTKQQFVSNVLRMFNVLASYNEGDSELTLNIFEKIKSKPPIDLSEYISETEVDYSDFVSDYGKRSKFSYQEVDITELRDYNVAQYFKYSQGFIEVDNDFLEPDVSVLESDFANPVAYLSPVFNMSMEKLNLIELEETDSTNVTSVTDNAGVARFNIGDDVFFVNDLIRITNSTNPAYNGDWIVETVSAGYVEIFDLPFDTDATADITKLSYTYSNNDDVFIFINVPNYTISNFSSTPTFIFEGDDKTMMAMAYFDIINTGRQVNLDFQFSLSFGGIDDPLHYQVTMIEQYFRLFSRVLNDPVKLYCTANIPYYVFHQIDFLSPITVKTLETTNEYYLNRITGYKESFLPCTLELIKLP